VQPYRDYESSRDERERCNYIRNSVRQHPASRSPSSVPLLSPGAGLSLLPCLRNLRIDTLKTRKAGPGPTSQSPRLMTMTSFSLVDGRISKCDFVVAALEGDGSLGTLEPKFEPLLTLYLGRHYHSSRSHSHGSTHSGSVHRSDTSSDIPLSDRSLLPPALLPAPILAGMSSHSHRQ
jgi:hypothetical protein